VKVLGRYGTIAGPDAPPPSRGFHNVRIMLRMRNMLARYNGMLVAIAVEIEQVSRNIAICWVK